MPLPRTSQSRRGSQQEDLTAAGLPVFRTPAPGDSTGAPETSPADYQVAAEQSAPLPPSTGGSSSPGSASEAARKERPAPTIEVTRFAEELVGRLFTGAGQFANVRLRHAEDDVWIPTEDEVDDLSGPGGSIVARRAPALSGDLVDGLSALVVLVAYGIRNVRESLRLRKQDRADAPGGDLEAA